MVNFIIFCSTGSQFGITLQSLSPYMINGFTADSGSILQGGAQQGHYHRLFHAQVGDWLTLYFNDGSVYNFFNGTGNFLSVNDRSAGDCTISQG